MYESMEAWVWQYGGMSAWVYESMRVSVYGCKLFPSLVPSLPFQLSVACSTGKAERVSDGKLEGKPGYEASYFQSSRAM